MSTDLYLESGLSGLHSTDQLSGTPAGFTAMLAGQVSAMADQHATYDAQIPYVKQENNPAAYGQNTHYSMLTAGLYNMQRTKLDDMFGAEAAQSEIRSYNTSASHSLLSNTDNTLRGENLSPSSSNQDSPARPEGLTELQPLKKGSHITDLQHLVKPTTVNPTTEAPAVSKEYSAFFSVKAESSSPTYYNSLATVVSQSPGNVSAFSTPSSVSHAYYPPATMPTSAGSAYYSPVTAPAAANSAYYSAQTTPTAAYPSYYSSLDGMTTPYTDYSQYSTPNSAKYSNLTSPSPVGSANHPTLTSPTFTDYSRLTTPTGLSSNLSDISSLSQYRANGDVSPLSQYRASEDTSPLSQYRPNGAPDVASHPSLVKSEGQSHDYMTSPVSDFNHTQGRDFSPYPSYTGVAKPAGVGIKPSTLSLQEMEAERSVSRARKNRTCFTEKQIEELENVFGKHKYPDVYMREQLAMELELKDEVIRVWFKNRRAKCKRDNKKNPNRSEPVTSSHNVVIPSRNRMPQHMTSYNMAAPMFHNTDSSSSCDVSSPVSSLTSSCSPRSSPSGHMFTN